MSAKAANPTPLSYEQAQHAYRMNAEQRHKATAELQDALSRKAQSEHDYRKALSVAFAKQRAKGEPVAAAEIHAKADAAHFALARDMTDAEAKGAQARLEQLKDDRATIRHLADWGRDEAG
jgi:hypothetical protein